MRMIDTKRNRKRRLFRVGVAFFLLCIVSSIVGAQEQPSTADTIINTSTADTIINTSTADTIINTSTADTIINTSTADTIINTSTININTSTVNISTATPMIPDKVGLLAIVFLVIAFGALVLLGYRAKERGRLDMGEMRRAIAGTSVMGFTILMILCLTYDIYQSEVILAYIELVGIIIGFYFGSRTAAEKRAEAAVKISIEHVRFPDPKKIAITIRNGGDSEIKVDKIYINEGAFETDHKFDSQKSKEIEQVYEWKSETEYKIKIATMTGLTAEITGKSP